MARSPRGADKAAEFLAGLAREFTAVLSLDHLVTYILHALRDVAGFDSCTIALVDRHDPDRLTVVGATGLCPYSHGSTVPRGQSPLWATIDAHGPLNIPNTLEDPRAEGERAVVHSSIYVPLLTNGRAIGTIGAHRADVGGFTVEDVDLLALLATYLSSLFEAARAHERMAEMAFADPLTDLPNRRAFLDRLGVELLRSRRTHHSLSIALVDVDGFKAVNDRYGHPAGDAALRHVAQNLKRNIRGYDFVARYGGDEFVLLFPDTPKQIAEEICRKFRTMPHLGGSTQTPTLTLSWGIACCPDDGDAADVMLGVADARLYEMKGVR